MGVTVYLFDSHMSVRAVLAKDVVELLHTEHEYMLDAKIPARYAAEPGEYLGFACVDGRFRLFEIDGAEDDSSIGLTVISATDAGAAELNSIIAPETRLEGKTASEMTAAVLEGSGWTLGTVTATDRTGYAEWYYRKVWACLSEIKTIYNARVVPYYTFDGSKLTAKKVDVLARVPVFRGRIFQGRAGAEDISIRLSGSPRSVMYGLGKTTGTGSVPERLTFADVVWSVANGDPADKPEGQDWIADPEAVETYGRKADIYDDSDEEDAEKLLQKTWEALQARKKPTVEGTATAQDMEMAPGQDWRKVRLYDQVGVVDRRGVAVMTQVLEIERDYIRPWMTKFTLGDEAQEEAQKKRNSLASQISAMDTEIKKAGGGGRGAGNAAAENREYIVENKELIRLHTIDIAANGSRIQETEIRMEDAEVSIAAAEKTLSSQGERLNTVEVDLNGSDSSIGLIAKVQQNTEEISSANVRIDGANAQINLKASKTEVDALGSRVSQAEIDIDGAKSQITLKANKTVVDGILSTGLAGVGTLSATNVAGNRGNFDSLSINGDSVVSHSVTVLKSVSLSAPKTTFTDYYGDQYTVVASASLTTKSETIVYLST